MNHFRAGAEALLIDGESVGGLRGRLRRRRRKLRDERRAIGDRIARVEAIVVDGDRVRGAVDGGTWVEILRRCAGPGRRGRQLDRRAINSPHEVNGSIRETATDRSEEHTSELQSLTNLVCRLLLETQ